MGQVQVKRSKLEPRRHRWAPWCWIALSAVGFTACGSGFFGGDESADAGAGTAALSAAEASEEAQEDAEAEQDSVVEVPRDTQEESDLVEGEDPVDAGEPPEAGAVTEDEADGTEEECRWETEEGADIFGDYMMANVVCTILALESTGPDALADALAVLPDGTLSSGETGLPNDIGLPEEIDSGAPLVPEALDLLASEPEVLEARFGWRCSVGEQGDSSDSRYYSFDHSGRLEVFASNGGAPQTLQFEQAQPSAPYEAPTIDQPLAFDQDLGINPQFELGGIGQPVDAGLAREAAVLVRFGSDYHPITPSWEVVVSGADLDPNRDPAVRNQRITYEGLWRNSENRPPRDRAGVLSVLEDRNYGDRFDSDEFETSQEHARHHEHLLYAPDEMVAPITAALLRDTSGSLYTAIAGIYIDFDISGWEEHVAPVLDLCWVRDVPLPPPEPVESEDAAAPVGSEDAAAPVEFEGEGDPVGSEGEGDPVGSEDEGDPVGSEDEGDPVGSEDEGDPVGSEGESG